MTKPLVKLNDVPFDDVEANGFYTSRRARFRAGIGARKLGYNLIELAPGVIACPTGGAEVAHQIINTGKVPLRYPSLSTQSSTEVCEYADSGKIGVFASTSPGSDLRRMFRAENCVEYCDRESLEPPASVG
jgi:hypothetical protein